MIVEKQLLPRPELEPAYDEIVWLYVFRDFSGSDEDRAAERICLRLGMTSYPQHKLIHPETLERLADTGRSLESFLAAVQRTKVEKARYTTAADIIADAEKRAIALEKDGSVRAAKKAIEDDDVVVRLRALEILKTESPTTIVARAAELLKVPNDPFRYAVCQALEKQPDPRASGPLAALVETPRDSLNPNVLRMRAVAALGRCGGADAVDVIAPFAASGAYRNGLTNVSVDALVAIAERERKARKRVRAVLVTAFPEPTDDERLARACTGLAKRVHAALERVTGKKVKFPKTYDAAARAKLADAW